MNHGMDEGRTRLGEQTRTGAVIFAASATLLAAMFVNFLNFSDYPLLRVETGLAALGLLILSALMTLFYLAQRRRGRAILEVILVYLTVDLVTEGFLFPLVAAAVAGAVLLRTPSVAGPAAVMGSVMLLTSLVGIGGSKNWIDEPQQARPASPNPKLPTVLHLILDEHIGLDGIPQNSADGVRLKQEMSRFYEDRQFTIYDRAYSEHMHTINAIPFILNYGRPGNAEGNKEHVKVGRSQYFQDLRARGYDIEVFQSEFADFCSGNEISVCVEYNSRALAASLVLPLSSIERGELLLSTFMSLSDVLVSLDEAFRSLGTWAPPMSPFNVGRRSTSSLGSFVASDALVKRLEGARPGTIYLAHLLFPHYPYVTRADCSSLPPRKWSSRRSEIPLRVRQSNYANQVRCTMLVVDKLVGALNRSPHSRTNIVVIHGDHGSRVTRIDPDIYTKKSYSDADAIAAFSTLFVVRGMEAGPAHYGTPASAAALLHALIEKDLRTPPSPPAKATRQVYLDDNDWRPQSRANVPTGW